MISSLIDHNLPSYIFVKIVILFEVIEMVDWEDDEFICLVTEYATMLVDDGR